MEMKVESEAGTQIMLVILYHYTKKAQLTYTDSSRHSSLIKIRECLLRAKGCIYYGLLN